MSPRTKKKQDKEKDEGEGLEKRKKKEENQPKLQNYINGGVCLFSGGEKYSNM